MADKSNKIKIFQREDNEIHSTKLQIPITLDTLGILALAQTWQNLTQQR